MEVTVAQVLVGFVVFLVSALFYRSRRDSRMPPGPVSLPIIGGLLSLRGSDVRESMLRLRDKYGDVFTIDLGGRRTVILASYETIKDALVKSAQVFSDRPTDLFFITEITEGKGIVSSNGRLWKEQRKFAHAVFREFGIGRPIFEDRIHEEVAHLVQALGAKVGELHDPSLLLQMSVSNVINNVTFGKRYEYEDPKFIEYMHIMNQNFKLLGNSGILTIMPCLKYLPGDLFEYKRLRQTSDYMEEQFKEQIREHRVNHTPGVVNDFIDAYIEESNKDEHQSKDTTFTDDQLLRVIGDLFGAGSETTTTTLRWAFLYLLRHPDVQTRVQEEIDQALGSSVPAMRDRARLPYTEAVILECQRLGDIVPLGVPHAVHQDVQFQGYHIPAGTTIMTLLYAAHRDPRVWKDPYRFNPERFLDDEGRISKDERLIPFSMGKRVCLGESLARMELFLFFTAIMQQLTFKCPPGEDPPPEESIVSITNGPKPFKFIIEHRH